MEIVKNYRPARIEFDIQGEEFPLDLGKFETAEEARDFINDNFVAIPSKLTTFRKLDDREIQEIRSQYQDELENNLPVLREAHFEAASDLEKAKTAEKDAKEMVSALNNKIQALAQEVKSGVTDISLDQAHTYEVVHNGQRLYYTYIDGHIKLAAVRQIASYENEDLLSSSEKNKSFFDGKTAAVGE